MIAALFPAGVWPAMITPFNEDRSIDWAGVDRLTDWYIASGVAGLFAVGQSSEMFALDDGERLPLARRVVRRANGRVPVLATGTFVRGVEGQAECIKRLHDAGVDAITVLAAQMAAPDEGDAVWRDRVARLLDLTGAIPLALYECPAPYHRLIPPDLVAWAAGTGRFHLLKETSRSLDAVRAKIDAARGTPLGIFNADATTLLASLRDGARGYCGIAANYYPDLLAWLCAHFAAEPAGAQDVQAFLGIADTLIHQRYPVAAKHYRQLAGFDLLTVSRVMDDTLTDYDRRMLRYLHAQAERVRAGLPAPRPGA